MNEQEELIKRLSFENYIWVVFIVVSIFSIYGDELIKKSIINKNSKDEKKAKDVFSIVLIVTILIYTYFLMRNYSDLKNNSNKQEYQIRFLGSILLLAGSICLLYFQLTTTTEKDSLSNI